MALPCCSSPAGYSAGRGTEVSVAGAIGRIRKYFSWPHTDIEGTTVLQKAVLYPLWDTTIVRHLKYSLKFLAVFGEE